MQFDDHLHKTSSDDRSCLQGDKFESLREMLGPQGGMLDGDLCWFKTLGSMGLII